MTSQVDLVAEKEVVRARVVEERKEALREAERRLEVKLRERMEKVKAEREGRQRRHGERLGKQQEGKEPGIRRSQHNKVRPGIFLIHQRSCSG